jgi:intracellular septation protein
MIESRARRSVQSRSDHTSPWLKFGVELGPLILFLAANAYPAAFAPAVAPFLAPSMLTGPNGALFTATLVLMAAVAAALALSFLALRRLPAVPLITAILVLIFGTLTLYLQDSTFIKMKPTVLYAGFSAALIAGLVINRPVLPIIFAGALDLPDRAWRLLTYRWAGFFFALALLNEIVWRTQPDRVWVAFKFPGLLILIALFSLTQAPLVRRHGLQAQDVDGVQKPRREPASE